MIKAFWRIYAKNNVEFRLLLPYESSLWLVVLSLSRFFRSNAKKNLVKLLILYLAHKNIFCLHFFIATVDVCLLLSSEGAPKKLKATTITKLKKLKIGFLTTLSSECIWQHCFFSNSSMDSGRIFRCFHDFFPIVIAHENVICKAFFYSHEFFWILYCLRIFYLHELSSQNSIFVHRLFWRILEFSIFSKNHSGGSRVRKC